MARRRRDRKIVVNVLVNNGKTLEPEETDVLEPIKEKLLHPRNLIAGGALGLSLLHAIGHWLGKL